MRRFTSLTVLTGFFLWAGFAQAQSAPTLGGVRRNVPAAGSSMDVRQDPNSSLDFGAVRGTGVDNIGENFRGNLGASVPEQGAGMSQGLPTSGVSSPTMNFRSSLDLSPNLRNLDPKLRGSAADLKGVTSEMILPRFQAHIASNRTGAGGRVPDDWRYRFHNGRWWYWMTNRQWSYWNGAEWAEYAAPAPLSGR